jgi:hypothetical protein
MSRKSNGFEDLFKSLGGENGGLNLGELLNGERISQLTSQMSQYLFNPQIVSQILDANPSLTDEILTEQIHLFEKSHPESSEIISKYLYSYQEKRENKNVYNIHKFVKSDDCKKALDDPKVKAYLQEAINSSEIKDQIQQAFNAFYKKK